MLWIFSQSPVSRSAAPRPISNQQLGLELPHPRGGIDPEDLSYFSRVVGVVDALKYLYYEDRTLSSPGASGPRQLATRAGSTNSSQPEAKELGFAQRTGGYHSGGSLFLFQGCCCCNAWKDSDPGIGPYSPRGRQGFDVDPRGNSRRALAPRTSANQQLASGVGTSTPYGAVSTRGIYILVLMLLELQLHGRISDPRTRNYPPTGAAGPRRCLEGRVSLRGSMSPRPSVISRWGRVFHTVWGVIKPGDHRFCPRIMAVAGVWTDLWLEIEILSSLGAADSMSSSESTISLNVGVSTPCGAVSTRGIAVSVPGWW